MIVLTVSYAGGYDSELVSREINIQVMAVNCRIFGMH